MTTERRLDRLEAEARPARETARKARRLLELIALGTLRARGHSAPCDRDVSGRTEAELLTIVGARDRAHFDDVMRGFVSSGLYAQTRTNIERGRR